MTKHQKAELELVRGYCEVMRRLPTKRSEKQNRIIEMVEEWFGEMNSEEKKSCTRIALWLMNRRKSILLTREEKDIALMVQQNRF